MCDELLTRRFFNDKRRKRDDGNGHFDMSVVSRSRPSLARRVCPVRLSLGSPVPLDWDHGTRVRDPIHPSGCRRAGWPLIVDSTLLPQMPVKCQILVTEHAVARLDSCAGAGSFAGEPSRRGPARPMTGCPRVTSHCQHPVLFGGRPGVGTTGAWGVPDTRCQIPSIYQTATVTVLEDHRFVNLGDNGFGLEEVVVVVVVVLHLPC
ncbi:hypothetical protein NEUTE2DRAFT_125896 [Neurospora tetrasperma FGSC 2509]|nr:hypothetical protein NEUTE2DRAFT_125896 [Neurospora tetrasperma FGSC 2509]